MANKKHREELYRRHLKKQEIEKWTCGKLIEENHNGYDYSAEFLRRSRSWYLSFLWMKTKQCKEDHGRFFRIFQGVREKLQTLLLHWPETVQRDWSFWFIKELLDMYRSGHTGIWERCDEKFKELGI